MNAELEEKLEEFRVRTGLPPRATREELDALNGRYLTTEPFPYQGTSQRMEQMQMIRGPTRLYVWKRFVPEISQGNPFLFQIHIEICDGKVTPYEYEPHPNTTKEVARVA